MGFFKQFAQDVKQGVGGALNLTKGVAQAVAAPVARTAAAPVLGLLSSLSGKDVKIDTGKLGLGVLKPGISVDDLNASSSKDLKTRQAAAASLKQHGVEQAADTAQNALMLLGPGGSAAATRIGEGVATKAVGEKLAQEGITKALSRYAIKSAVQAPVDAAIGAGTNVAASVGAGEKDPEKLKQDAKSGAFFGTFFPHAVEGGTKLLTGAVGGARRLLSDPLRSAEIALEKRAKPTFNGEEILPGQSVEAKYVTGAQPKEAGAMTRGLYETVRGVRRLVQNVVDSDAPVNSFATKLEAKGMADQAKLIRDASESARSGDVQGFGKAVTYGADRHAAFGYDPKDRLGNIFNKVMDQKSKLDTLRGSDVERGVAQKGIDDTLATLKPEERTAMVEAEKLYRQQNDAILDRAVQSGLVGKDKADLFRRSNPNYSKLMVREYLDTESKRLNMSRRDVADNGVRGRDTSKEFNPDTLDATTAQAYNAIATERLATRNEKVRAMIDADTAGKTGEFQPIWTVADEAKKKELLGALNESAGVKNALIAEQSRLKKDVVSELSKQSKAGEKAQSSLQTPSAATYFKKQGVENYNPSMTAAMEGDINQMFLDKIKSAGREDLEKLALDLSSLSKDRRVTWEELQELQYKLKAVERGTDIRVFRDGVEEVYAANDPRMTEYFRRQDGEGLETLKNLGNGLKGFGDFTRRYATQRNVPFIARNMMKDMQEAAQNLGLTMTPAMQAENLLEASKWLNGGRSKKIEEALQLGGLLSSPSIELKDQSVRGLTEMLSGRGKAKGFWTGIEKMNEASEMATRLSIMDGAKAKGITDPAEIRRMMREGTVDFRVAGDVTREFNKFIPFLNANVQGIRVQMKNLIKDPAGYARRAQMLAIYPQLLLEANNQKYPAYRYIDENTKSNNFIFMTGQHDEDGVPVPDFVTIPKGQAGKIFANITAINEDDTLKPEEREEAIARQFLSQFPITSNIVEGQTIVPGGSPVQTMIGLAYNKNYKGMPIIPDAKMAPGTYYLDQVQKNTTNFAKTLAEDMAKVSGDKVKIAPAQIDFFLRTLWSGTGSNALDLFNAADKTRMGEEVKPNELPILSSFIRSGGRSVPQSVENEQEQMLESKNKVKFEANQSKESYVDKLKSGEVQIKDVPIEVKKEIVEDLKKKQYTLGISASDASNVAAAKFIQQAERLKDSAAKEDLLNRIKDANLATPAFVDSVRTYRIYQRIKAASPEERKAIAADAIGELGQGIDLKKMAEDWKVYADMGL